MQLHRHSTNESGTVVVDEFGKSYMMIPLHEYETLRDTLLVLFEDYKQRKYNQLAIQDLINGD